jgi:hypothetical protein
VRTGPGDYVVSVELPALRRVVGWLQQVRRRLFPWTAEPGRGAFALPFVDYARGDGATIGAGHALTWGIEQIDDDTPWVRDYRGLWGLDTHDPFGGERAPAGPRYSRNGELRPSWVDPLGWVGLAAVPATPAEEETHLRARIAELREQERALAEEIDTERTAVRGLTAQARALDTAADTRALRRERVAETAEHRLRPAERPVGDGEEGHRRGRRKREGARGGLRRSLLLFTPCLFLPQNAITL